MQKVQYTIEANFSEYNCFRESFTFTLEISQQKTLRQAVDEIRQNLANQFGENYRREIQKRIKLEEELRELQLKIDEAKTKWERTKEFLTAQGIRTDVPDFPNFNNYLLPSSQETVDAEIEDEDEDEDDDILY